MCPEPRAVIRRRSSRAIRTGASRLTRRARPISSWREAVEPARGRQAGVGDQDVEVAGGLEQAQRLAASARSRAHRPVSVPGSSAASRPSSSPLRSSGPGSRRGRERRGDGPSEASGGPGEQGGLAARVHARPTITAKG